MPKSNRFDLLPRKLVQNLVKSVLQQGTTDMKGGRFPDGKIVGALKERMSGSATLAGLPEARHQFADLRQVDGQVRRLGGIGRRADE
jgi:hypothetical protein